MTRTEYYVALHDRPPAERLPGLAEAQTLVLQALTTSCEPSGRATVDLREIAMRMRMRDLTFRIALLGLRLARRVGVEQIAGERATITLPEVEVTP